MAESNLSAFLWSVADLLRGDFKQSDYGKVILPFTVLRRLDCVLEPTKAAVLKEYEARTKAKVNPEPFLIRKAQVGFYNTSPLDLRRLLGDQDSVGENLRAYVEGFSGPVRDIFEHFDFATQIDRLQKAKLLYLVTEKFANVDLHPDKVSNADTGLLGLGYQVCKAAAPAWSRPYAAGPRAPQAFRRVRRGRWDMDALSAPGGKRVRRISRRVQARQRATRIRATCTCRRQRAAIDLGGCPRRGECGSTPRARTLDCD